MDEDRTETEQPSGTSGIGPWTEVLDLVSALVVILDAEGRIVRVNGPFADLVGGQAKELEGCELWELVEAEQVEVIRRMFSLDTPLDRPRMAQLKWLSGENNRQPIVWTFSPIADDDQTDLLVLGVGFEFDAADVPPGLLHTGPNTITPEEEPEHILDPEADLESDLSAVDPEPDSMVAAETVKLIEPLVEHSSDIICVMTAEGIIDYVSAAVSRNLGYDMAELIGTSGLELVHPDDLDQVTPVIERGLEEPGTPQQVECRLRHADGSWRDVEARGVTYEVNDSPSVIINITDITARKETEKALTESEIRFRSAFEFTAIGKVLWSLDGKVVRVNRAVCNIYGYGQDELLGRPWRDLVHPDHMDDVSSQLHDLRDGISSSAQLDVQVKHHDGPWIWTRATMSAISDAAGDPQNIIGELEDITEQRLAEEEKRSRLQRVEQQQAAIVELATNGAVTSGERDEAFRVITEAAAAALELERVGVWLLNEDDDALHCLDLFDRTANTHSNGLVIEATRHPAYFDALEMGRVVDADDARSDPRTEELIEEYLEPNGVRSILDAPIRMSGEVVGVVRHEQVSEPRIWQADEIKFAGEVADQAANSMVSAQRKRSEKRLQQSEERFRSIVNSSPMGLLMYRLEDDDRLVFTGANPAADAILGSDCQKYIGKNIEEAFPPLADTEVPDKYRRVAAEGTPWHIEQIEYEDELIRGAYEVHAFQTAPNTVTVMFIDITDRKRAEEAVRESEERYRQLFERNLAAVYRSALDGRILECNDAFADIFGCGSRSEALSLGAFDFYLSAYDRDRTLETLRTEGELKNRELTLKKISGEPVWVLANLSMVNDDNGNPTIIEGTMIDISQRKEAADRLELQSTALESAANAIAICEPDGTIEWVNQAFSLLTGYSASDAVGESLWMLKSGREDDALYEDIRESISSGRVWQGELVNRRKDGRLYTEDTTITPVKDADDTISRFITVQQDVSERKRMEEQLLQAQKMEAVGRLAGGVAHDFNNLLQAMLGVTELLRQPDLDQGDAALKLQELEEHVQRGSQLTRQLLLFSRRDTARQEELDLNEVVRGTVKLLNRLLRENIELDFAPDDKELPLTADRGQVEQVVMNLAVNACDAMPHGGSLALITGLDAGSAWLEVSDTGEGIPEAIRDQLFEPFFTTKEAGKGTGLGLSVVHGIITRLGGRIDLDSDVGEGTTIRVTFPGIAVTGAGRRRVPDREMISEGEGERVLVVEDDPAVRVSLEEILAVLGYQVTSVGGVEEAIRLPVEPAFDLLLTDYVLPDGSGTEIADQLRDRWQGLGVIVMSGYAQDEVVSREAARGSLNFLQKPFSAQVLGNTVRAALTERDAAIAGTTSD